MQNYNRERAKPPYHGTGKRWAILVGINKYRDEAHYGTLHVCVEDVKRIRDVLLHGGFTHERLHILADGMGKLPLKEDIITELKAVAQVTEPDDTLLFYFSGHGRVSQGESYLIPKNAREITLPDTAIAVSRIKEILSQAPAKAKVIILDACHSGIALGTKAAQPMEGAFLNNVFQNAQGLAILSSCKQGQYSHEWQEKRCSVFTYYLFEALRGEADYDHKGFVTVYDANKYVTNGVKEWASRHQAEQSPTLSYLVEGDIMLTIYQSQSATAQERPAFHAVATYLAALRAAIEQTIEVLTQEQVWIKQCQPLFQTLSQIQAPTILSSTPTIDLANNQEYEAVVRLFEIETTRQSLCKRFAHFIQDTAQTVNGEDKQRKTIIDALRILQKDIIDESEKLFFLDDLFAEASGTASGTKPRSYLGEDAALRAGTTYQDIYQKLQETGVEPKKSIELPKEDILARFRAVPLHALFLYSSEDEEVEKYVHDHLGSLDTLAGNACDIHPLLSQFQRAEDVYDYMNKLDVVRQAGFDRHSQLPGIFFHDQHRQSEFVSFGTHPDQAEIRRVVRTVFEEVRREPTLKSVARARERLAGDNDKEHSFPHNVKPFHGSTRKDASAKQMDGLNQSYQQPLELIQALQQIPTGNGPSYEELIKRILTFCFADEFRPFELKEQVQTLNQKRRRDFIINNRNPTISFWRDLKIRQGVEKILFDAKNYAKPIRYDEITSTLRYLKSPAFGNLLIILSRQGVKDMTEFVEDYSQTGSIVIILKDEDLISMILQKERDESASSIIEDKFFQFLDLL